MRWILPVTLFFLAFLSYAPILGNALFYDDEELIYKNTYVQDITKFPLYWTTNMIAGAGKESRMYRPLLLTSFAIDWSIWKTNPAGYHLTSIILHGLNGILVFLLAGKIIRKTRAAFLTAVLFIIHPVQTEAVAYASGRTDLLFVFFFLLCALFFWAFLSAKKKRLLPYSLSLLCFLLSLFSKETAIITPLLLFLLYVKKEGMRKSSIRALLPFAGIALVYITVRLTILHFLDPLNFYAEATPYSTSLAVRIFTFMHAVFSYLFLFLFPKDLIFARDIPIISSALNLWVLLFLLLFSFALFFAFRFRKTHPVFLFSLLWFFISLSPVSGIIPINSTIAEHYLYLPSIGIFLSTGVFFDSFARRLPRVPASAFSLTLALYLAILIGRTVHRTFDWRDAIVFYTRSLDQSPEHIPMRHNLAMSYQDRGDLQKAVSQYRWIIDHADVYPNTHHNLANAYVRLGLYQEAEEEYKRALTMDPAFRFSYYALLDLYRKTGQKEKLELLLTAENRRE